MTENERLAIKTIRVSFAAAVRSNPAPGEVAGHIERALAIIAEGRGSDGPSEMRDEWDRLEQEVRTSGGQQAEGHDTG